MTTSEDWTQLNTQCCSNSIAYEYVHGDEPMASFRSVEELRSTYPQEDSDTDSEPGKTASLNMKRKTKQNK